MVAHADAMAFVTNMSKDLVGRQSTAEVVDFFMTTDPKARMDKLFSYFPGVMAQNITMGTDPLGPLGGASLIDGLAGMPAAMVDGFIAATQLTAQQQAIMGSLLTPARVGAVMANLTPAEQAVLGGIMVDPKKAQLFQQMVAQGMLGGGADSYSQVRDDERIRNNLLYTNRFGLDLKAKATKDISVTARLTMYKTFGSMDDDATTGGYFADRVGAFDGTLGHTPSSDFLSVDRVYATWSNIGGQPVWFSVGRRPSTGGAPGHVRQLGDGPGKAGVPSLLVDYAFDGMTLGFAPDLEALPGMFAKICYGRGFESGISRTGGANLRDTDMVGVSVVPYDTKALRLDLQWNRGSHIFDFPKMYGTGFGDTAPAADLGAIDWLGLGALGEVKAANLTWFASYGLSFTHPNDNVSANAGNQGLLTGEFFAKDESPDDKTGWAVYLGGRFDLKATGTSLGAEYNHGSKNWITFAPAADDMWTAKLGTRGNVYEVYAIQNLNLAPVSSFFSKAFFRLGYQYYDFEYTGSNNWVGAPQKIDDLSATDLALLAPVEKAYNLYGTFQVNF